MKSNKARWLLSVAFAVLGVLIAKAPIQKGTFARDVTAPPHRPHVFARDVTAPPHRPHVFARDVTAPPHRPHVFARDVATPFGYGLV
jgi:hypothetical protein